MARRLIDPNQIMGGIQPTTSPLTPSSPTTTQPFTPSPVTGKRLVSSIPDESPKPPMASKDLGGTTAKQSFFDSHPWMKKVLGFVEEPVTELRKAAGYVGEKLATAIPQTEFEKQIERKMATPEQAQAEKQALESSTSFTGQNVAPAKTAKEAIGAGLKGAGEVGSFAAPGLGELSLAAGIESFGGALEEDKSLLESGISGVLSAGATAVGGKLLEGFGGIVGEGLKGVINKIGRTGRGLSALEVNTIQKVPTVVEGFYDKLKLAKDIPQQQEAVQKIESEIYDKGRDIFSSYAKKAGKQFEEDMTAHAATNVKPGAPPISQSDFVETLKSLAEDAGGSADVFRGRLSVEGGTEADRAMLGKIYNKVKKAVGTESITGEMGFKGLNNLRKDVGSLYENSAGTSSERAMLDKFYANIKTRMSSMVKDPAALQSTMDAYKNFMVNKQGFKKLTSPGENPQAMRQGFMELLRGVSGGKGQGGMADALKIAEQEAGMKPGELAYMNQALELSKKLAGVSGKGFEPEIASAVKRGVGREGLNFSLGNLAAKALESGAKSVADKKFMENLFKEGGMNVGNPTLQRLSKMLSSPATRSILYNLARTMMEQDGSTSPQTNGGANYQEAPQSEVMP